MAVKPVTNLGRSGLSDWLMQRVSAVVIALYTLWLTGYLLAHPDLTYAQWAGLHQYFPMRLFSLLAVLAMAVHAWIGLWAVLTDYVTVRLMGGRATVLRVLLQVGMVGALLAYVIWAVDILWRG